MFYVIYTVKNLHRAIDIYNNVYNRDYYLKDVYDHSDTIV